MSVTLLLADDHAIVREGLRALLELDPGLNVVGDAQNGREAVQMAKRLRPQVVVMDIGMPDLNGIEATRQIIAADPGVKVVALSTYGDTQFVLAMFEAGAAGYVLKSAASDELMNAISAVLKHQKYLSPSVSNAALEQIINGQPDGQGALLTELTSREREVLQLLAEGKTSKEIAKALGNAEGTVEVHRRNIMKKLKVNTVAELTKYAIRQGLTSL